jgi:hypothetical protein
MNDTIEPGDLVRGRLSGKLYVSEPGAGPGLLEMVAKGPGWVEHGGSSVNPVPGARCQVYGARFNVCDYPSQVWPWEAVQFYRVTKAAPSQPPAPQPGWVATVTIKMVEPGEFCHTVEFPNGLSEEVPVACFSDVDWSPPPLPPWEPEIGKGATYQNNDVTVLFIGREMAMVEDRYRNEYEATLSDLSPPKGGA